MAEIPRRKQAIWLGVAASSAIALVVLFRITSWAAVDDGAVVTARAGDFRQILRRTGTLKPISEKNVFARVWGAITEIVEQGTKVAPGDVVLRLDPTPHQDGLRAIVSEIERAEAEYREDTQNSAKTLNQVKEDVVSNELRLELQKMRLAELKKGPAPADLLKAQVALENARNLLQGTQDEYEALRDLANAGYASQEEARHKELGLQEQKLATVNAELALRKLNTPDDVQIAEQELQVREAQKAADAAREKVKLVEVSIKQAEEQHALRVAQQNSRKKIQEERISRTVYTAPGPGVVIHNKHRWYNYAPGRDVWEGLNVLTIPDLSRMKVLFTVDEGRIGLMAKDQPAVVYPAGWEGAPFKGKITRVAGKGRDEFENFREETSDLVGGANRQVFEVEVEIDGECPPLLRPDLRAEVEVEVRHIENTCLIPRLALRKDVEGRTLVDLAGGGTRPVTVLAEDDLTAAVSGVEPGEQIRITGGRP